MAFNVFKKKKNDTELPKINIEELKNASGGKKSQKDILEEELLKELNEELKFAPEEEKEEEEEISEKGELVNSDGTPIKSLQQMIDFLKELSDKDFKRFVNSKFNVIAEWAADELQEEGLSIELALLKTKQDIISKLQAYIISNGNRSVDIKKKEKKMAEGEEKPVQEEIEEKRINPEEAKKILMNVPKGKEFNLLGKKISSIEELNKALRELPKRRLETEFMKQKKELSDWLEKTVGDERVSKRIKNANDIKTLSKIIQRELSLLEDMANAQKVAEEESHSVKKDNIGSIEVGGKELKHPFELLEKIKSMDSDEFNSKIIPNKREIVEWLIEKDGNPELSSLLFTRERDEFVKKLEDIIGTKKADNEEENREENSHEMEDKEENSEEPKAEKENQEETSKEHEEEIWKTKEENQEEKEDKTDEESEAEIKNQEETSKGKEEEIWNPKEGSSEKIEEKTEEESKEKIESEEKKGGNPEEVEKEKKAEEAFEEKENDEEKKNDKKINKNNNKEEEMSEEEIGFFEDDKGANIEEIKNVKQDSKKEKELHKEEKPKDSSKGEKRIEALIPKERNVGLKPPSSPEEVKPQNEYLSELLGTSNREEPSYSEPVKGKTSKGIDDDVERFYKEESPPSVEEDEIEKEAGTKETSYEGVPEYKEYLSEYDETKKESLKLDLKQLESSIAMRKEEIKALNETLESRKRLLTEELNDELGEFKKRRDELSNKIRELNAKRRELENELSKLMDKKKDEESYIKEEVENRVKEITAIKERLENENKELKERLAVLEKNAEESSIVSSKKENLEKVEKRIRKKKGISLEGIEEKKKVLEQEVKWLSDKKDALREELKDIEKRIESGNNDLERLWKKKEEVEKNLEKQEELLNKKAEELKNSENIIKKLEDQIEAAKKLYNDTNKDYTILLKELYNIENTKKRLESENEDLKEEILGRQKLLNKIKKESKSFDRNNKKVQDIRGRNELRKALEEQYKMLKETKNEKKKIEAENRKLKKEVEKLKKSVKEKEEKNISDESKLGKAVDNEMVKADKDREIIRNTEKGKEEEKEKKNIWNKIEKGIENRKEKEEEIKPRIVISKDETSKEEPEERAKKIFEGITEEEGNQIEIPEPRNLNELRQLIETTRTLAELNITEQAKKGLEIIENAINKIKMSKLEKKNIEVEVRLLKLEGELANEGSA